MPQFTYRTILDGLIRSSVLLTEDRKNALLTQVDRLDERQAEELQALLHSEDALLHDIVLRAIERSAQQHDHAFLRELDTLLHACERNVRIAEEACEKSGGIENATSLLDTTT